MEGEMGTASGETESVWNALAEIRLPDESKRLAPDEFEKLLDEIADILPPDTPVLSDEAMSREGIYGDHP